MNIEGFKFKIISKHSYSNGEIIFIFDLDNFRYCWRWKNDEEPTSDIYHEPFNFDYCPMCFDTYENSKRCHAASYLSGIGGLWKTIKMEQLFMEYTLPLIPYDKILFN